MQVPEGISSLQVLEELNLADNAITPAATRGWECWRACACCTCKGTPLRSIRRPVLEKGTQAVLECLRGRIPAA